MKFVVETRYVFSGKFFVEADTKKEAERIVDEDCNMTLSGGIHSNCDDVDWEFDCHPEKTHQPARLPAHGKCEISLDAPSSFPHSLD
jgi:hypothetical protein